MQCAILTALCSTAWHTPLVHPSSLLYPTSERTNPEVPATRARITQPSTVEKGTLQSPPHPPPPDCTSMTRCPMGFTTTINHPFYGWATTKAYKAAARIRCQPTWAAHCSHSSPGDAQLACATIAVSQNHRITEVGKDPQDQQPNRPPTTSISHWATALSATSTPSSNTPRLVTPHSLGSPFQHPNTLLEKNFLLISNLPLLVHSHKATSISFSLFLLALFSPHNHKHVFWRLLTKQEYIPNRI